MTSSDCFARRTGPGMRKGSRRFDFLPRTKGQGWKLQGSLLRGVLRLTGPLRSNNGVVAVPPPRPTIDSGDLVAISYQQCSNLPECLWQFKRE